VLAGFDDLHLTFNAAELGVWGEETEELVAVTIPMGG
jgi:hypothetical protein